MALAGGRCRRRPAHRDEAAAARIVGVLRAWHSPLWQGQDRGDRLQERRPGLQLDEDNSITQRAEKAGGPSTQSARPAPANTWSFGGHKVTPESDGPLP